MLIGRDPPTGAKHTSPNRTAFTSYHGFVAALRHRGATLFLHKILVSPFCSMNAETVSVYKY